MKRRLVKLAVFLLLGAIVNVAVAWGCGWWAPVAPQDRVHALLDPQSESNRYAAASRAGIRSGFGVQHAVVTEVSFIYVTDDHNRNAEVLPTWMPADVHAIWGTLMWRDHKFRGYIWYVAEGWPLLALRCRVAYDRSAIGGIVVRSDQDTMGFLPHALGFCPIWPGFAINTVFYAVTLWVLFAAPFALRRRRRIRRGLCPACAYPVGMGASPVCTECGKEVSVVLRQSRDEQEQDDD